MPAQSEPPMRLPTFRVRFLSKPRRPGLPRTAAVGALSVLALLVASSVGTLRLAAIPLAALDLMVAMPWLAYIADRTGIWSNDRAKAPVLAFAGSILAVLAALVLR